MIIIKLRNKVFNVYGTRMVTRFSNTMYISCATFCNMAVLYIEEFLSLRPIPKLECHRSHLSVTAYSIHVQSHLTFTGRGNQWCSCHTLRILSNKLKICTPSFNWLWTVRHITGKRMIMRRESKLFNTKFSLGDRIILSSRRTAALWQGREPVSLVMI
jgi:hypothetical protein